MAEEDIALKFEKRKLTSLTRTCFACPSQWEGELEDGSKVYIRYRWGRLGMGIGETLDHAIQGNDAHYSIQLGDDYDGWLSTEEMLRILNLEVR